MALLWHCGERKDSDMRTPAALGRRKDEVDKIRNIDRSSFTRLRGQLATCTTGLDSTWLNALIRLFFPVGQRLPAISPQSYSWNKVMTLLLSAILQHLTSLYWQYSQAPIMSFFKSPNIPWFCLSSSTKYHPLKHKNARCWASCSDTGRLPGSDRCWRKVSKT